MVYQRLSKALSGFITHFLSLKLLRNVLSKTLCKKKEPVLRKKLVVFHHQLKFTSKIFGKTYVLNVNRKNCMK